MDLVSKEVGQASRVPFPLPMLIAHAAMPFKDWMRQRRDAR